MRQSGARGSGSHPKLYATAEEILEGVLDRVVFAAEDTGWSVVRVQVRGHREPVSAVGNLPGVQVGESIRLVGRWTTDPKYGQQFRADTYTTVKPSTLVGIEKYLGSGLVPGIGPKTASALVEKFGMQTLEVIELTPNRLGEVDGIGPVRAARIRKAWEEQRAIKEVMVFLHSHGVSTSFGVRIFRRYGPRAIEMVRSDPYRLAVDIFGIGFKTADAIAARLDIAKDSPRRIQAGLLHALNEATGDGHMFLSRGDLLSHAQKLLDQPPEAIGPLLDPLAKSGEIVIETDTRKEGDAAVFPRPLYICEVEIADRLRALSVAQATKPLSVDVSKAVAWFAERGGVSLSPGQVDALHHAVDDKVLVITGGPGTGKTTLLRAICLVLGAKGLSLQLAAPTGRAARRMTDATGFPARTLHRLLEFSPKTASFQRDRDTPIEADVVVIDEASMIDAPLCHHLLRAIRPGCRLILVGDADQLPSVGPGSVLRDLIDSDSVPVVRLTDIFRQAAESLIVMNAHRINQGEMPTLPSDAESDFFFLEREEPDAVLAAIKELVAVRLPRRLGVHPVRDIQVLSPMNRGVLGSHALNRELQGLLNPDGKAIAHGGMEFRVHDKVIQLRNNYDLDVFNGDIGVIQAVDEETGSVRVAFDDREVVIDSGDLDELALAYACTVHKAQGSEFPVVVIPVHTQHYPLLVRNLIYTAVTRGKRLVVMVGTRRALAIAMRRADAQHRNTRLAERLRTRSI